MAPVLFQLKHHPDVILVRPTGLVVVELLEIRSC